MAPGGAGHLTTAPGFRAALYWAPNPHDLLTRAGNTWLGRDPERNIALPQPDLPDIDRRTSAARAYGFHATLRAPMRLATGWHAFLATAAACAAAIAPFDLPALQVSDLDGFLALTPVAPCPALQALADGCVRETDMHRLPPSAAELARRLAAGLGAEEEALLQRWGYPYVMQRWRFHMTLTDRGAGALRAGAKAHFAEALATRRRVTEICVFTQATTAAPFLVAERLPLRRT